MVNSRNRYRCRSAAAVRPLSLDRDLDRDEMLRRNCFDRRAAIGAGLWDAELGRAHRAIARVKIKCVLDSFMPKSELILASET
jgi:hypothetical protein